MKIFNKRANRDYQIIERFEAGINLYGSEVKAIKEGNADINGSHVRIIGSEAYLVGAKVYPYEYARIENYDERRTRKLLLHKSQIIALKSRIESGNMGLVPLSMYVTKNLIKVEVGLGRGKKKFEKRATLKQKDIEREIERELSEAG